jgi:hypothetical protein
MILNEELIYQMMEFIKPIRLAILNYDDKEKFQDKQKVIVWKGSKLSE